MRIVYVSDSKSLFGLFRCTSCNQTWAPGNLPRHINCVEKPDIELVVGPAACGELESWAKKHGEDEPHFSMGISLNEFRRQVSESARV